MWNFRLCPSNVERSKGCILWTQKISQAAVWHVFGATACCSWSWEKWLCLPSRPVALPTPRVMPSFPTRQHTPAVAQGTGGERILTGVSSSLHHVSQWTHEYLCQYNGCDCSVEEMRAKDQGEDGTAALPSQQHQLPPLQTSLTPTYWGLTSV